MESSCLLSDWSTVFDKETSTAQEGPRIPEIVRGKGEGVEAGKEEEEMGREKRKRGRGRDSFSSWA